MNFFFFETTESMEKYMYLVLPYYRVSQKICYNPGNSTLLFHHLVFSGCLTRCVINAPMIVLFKSTVKLKNLSSDEKQSL